MQKRIENMPGITMSRRKARRTILQILIFGIWMTAVGWQVRREYFKPELTRIAEAAMSLAPGVNFYTLDMGGRAIGLATSRLDTIPDGFVLEDFMSIELPALGQTGTAVARSQVELSKTLQMREFDFGLDSEVGSFAAGGRVIGDTLLQVVVDAGGGEEPIEYRLSEPPVFAAALPIRLAIGEGLEVGSRFEVPVFDPSSLSTRSVEMHVVEHDTLMFPDSAALDADGRWFVAREDTVPAWKVAEVYGGVQVESWIDEDGRIIRASSPLGFSMIRTEYELARQAVEEARLAEGDVADTDIILATAVQSSVDLGEVESHDELRFVLSGVDLEGFDLDGGRQTLRGDTLIVKRENWDGVDPGYTLPYKRMDLSAELAPEPLIQSDHERIVSKAREITNWRTSWNHSPKRVARQLNGAVHHLLDKEITFSIPSALQVLESERGDCNEHTVLFVALARALGLPARTAVGLVYVDGSFYYHAWPEVWLDEWVAMDPTFGQYPADAAHIRFVIGGLAQQVEIVRLIGRLNIDVVPEGATPEG